MKSMMRGREKRRRRRIVLTACLAALLAVAAGVWLLFFQKEGKLQVTYRPAASPSDSAEAPADPAPSESVLGVSTFGPAPPVSADPNDWRLLLVNSTHSLPDGFEIKLTELRNGHSIDERCYPDLQKMMDDCRAAGCKPLICSSYRSLEKQQELFDRKVSSFVKEGASEDEVREKAAKIIAVPGTSDHQTGLAVDIVDIDNQNLDDSQEDTPVQKWLSENCWKYGFILRFPKDKTDITGVIYESWHYRYVGAEAAKEIFERGICLEEYLGQTD